MVRGKFHLNVLIYILYVIVTGVEHVHDLIYITLLKKPSHHTTLPRIIDNRPISETLYRSTSEL